MKFRIDKKSQVFFILAFLVLFFSLDVRTNCYEAYEVKKGDTLSEVLWRKGVKGRKALYGRSGREGAVKKNKELNPEVHDWRRIRPGDNINLKLPASSESCFYKDLEDSYYIQEDKKIAKLDEHVLKYYIEHRFNLGFGLTYVNETQNVQSLKTDAALILPAIQYAFIYRNNDDFNLPAWEARFFSELSYTLKPSDGVSLPIDGKLELGISRYSMLRLGKSSFAPYLGLRYSFDSSVTEDISENKSSRRLNAFSVGIRPEFTSYLGSRRIECAPFFYKSLYSKSLGERLGGYELGFRTDIGIAFSNKLTGFIEYSYDSYGNSDNTMDISWHKLFLGLGYRF